ncbi:F0F1 ATP synthase subunit gamma [Patescibacteria group bacterium]|nr:F0F1 ATP synthase subunit gamma [Patescibacteria group bacterium]MCL5409310.1 F0F1 ATP synthase subunit gamma [Patescibacteria group bacterium]
MPTIRQISQTLEESNSLKMVAQAYSEISAVKLQKIRAGIEKNRLFTEEIGKLYHMVQTAATRRSVVSHSSKKGTISIVLTSNDRFYGSLETELTRFFLVNTTKIRTDRLVIGRTAIDQLKSIKYFHTYQPLVFQNDLPSTTEIHQIAQLIDHYKQVVVYYSSFQSVLIQKPTATDITQSATETVSVKTADKLDYIFEPEVEQMLDFFNNQITMLLLEQTFFEAELARTAARLISMDQAQSNAEDFIKEQKRQLAAAKRSLENVYLLETIASLLNSRRNNYALNK